MRHKSESEKEGFDREIERLRDIHRAREMEQYWIMKVWCVVNTRIWWSYLLYISPFPSPTFLIAHHRNIWQRVLIRTSAPIGRWPSFPKNVTWCSKMYDKFCDKRVLGILIQVTWSYFQQTRSHSWKTRSPNRIPNTFLS